MDNAVVRMLAKFDPVLFFQTYRPPIIIDEIQKAPELFEQIKIICDQYKSKERSCRFCDEEDMLYEEETNRDYFAVGTASTVGTVCGSVCKDEI